MRLLLPLIITASSLVAADVQPQPAPVVVQPQPAPVVVQPRPQAAGPLVAAPPMPLPEAMKEQREVEAQWRAIRDKSAQDPELIAARKAVEDAQKAYRAKEEEVMAKDPAYAEVKAKRDALRAARMQPRPELTVTGRPTPPPPAPAPAPAVPAPAPAPAPAQAH